MGKKFESERAALRALRAGEISETEFDTEVGELLKERATRAATGDPSAREDLPRADLDEAAERKDKILQELVAFEGDEERNVGLETQESRVPTRSLFGRAGAALGLTDIADLPPEAQTVRGAIARAGLPLIERSPTRMAFEQGKISAEEAAEQLVAEADKKEEEKEQLNVPLLGLGRKTLFGFENPLLAEGGALSGVGQEDPTSTIGITKGKDGLGVRVRRPEFARKVAATNAALKPFRTLGVTALATALTERERGQILTPEAAELGLSLESDTSHVMRLAGAASDVVFEGLAELPAIGPGLGDVPALIGETRRKLQAPEEPPEGEEPKKRSAVERISNAISIALDPELVADPANRDELLEVADIALGGLIDQLRKTVQFRTVSEQQLGITTQQRLQDPRREDLTLPEEDMMSSWLRRSALSLERGTGLSGSTANAAVNSFGDTPEARMLGTLIGLPIEIMTPAEGIFLKPFTSLSKAMKAGGAALKVKPDFVSSADAFIKGARDSPLSVGQFYSEEIAQSIATGRFNPLDAPEEINGLVNELALQRHGKTIDEVFEPAGIARLVEDGPPPAPPKPFEYPHDFEPTSMTDFFRPLKRKKADPSVLPDNMGFEKLKHLDPDQSILDPKYVLLNAKDEPMAGGNLGQVIHTMLDRRQGGDQIWFGAQRKLGAWGENKLAADRLFSSFDEKRVIDNFLGSDLRASPAKLGTLETGAQVVEIGSRIVDPGHAKRHLLRAMNGRTTTKTTKVTPEQIQVATLYDEAYRVWGKNQLGSDQMKMLPWGGVATRAEYRSIIRHTDQDFKAAGLELRTAQMEKLPDGSPSNRLKLTEDQRANLAILADEAGSAVRIGDDTPFTTRDLNELREGIMRSHAEISTDVSFAMRGTLPTSERLIQGLLDQTGASNRGRYKKQSAKATATFLSGIIHDVDELTRPPKVRQLLKEFQRRLENVADELLQEMQLIRKTARQGGLMEAAKAGAKGNVLAIKAGLDKTFGSFDVTGPLLNIIRNYRPVTLRELKLLDEVKGIKIVKDHDRVFDLRDRLRESVRRLDAKEGGLLVPDPAATRLDVDPEIRAVAAAQVYDGLKQLQKRMDANMVSLAEKWVKANIPQASLDNPITKQKWGELDLKDWRAVYNELYGPVSRDPKGQPVRGPALEGVLTRIVGDGVKGFERSKPSEAATRLVLELRHEEVVEWLSARLLREEIGINDPVMHLAVSEALMGQHMIIKDGRTIFTQPQHIQAEVNNYIRRLGLTPGSREPLVAIKASPDVLVPESVQKFVDRAADLGYDSRQLALGTNVIGSKLASILNLTKQSMTHGVGTAFKPSHVLGNALGGLFQMHITLGTESAFRSVLRLGQNPQMALELMKRTGGLQGSGVWPARNNKGRIFTTPHGIYHIDDLEADMVRLGVDQAFGSFENRVSLLSDIGRQEPGFVNFMQRNLVGWQETLREFADGPERLFRIGVYLDELKKGTRAEDAAVLARRSNYDYGTLTEFERKHIRWIFMFYTFSRKNADAMIKAAVDHPDRVMQQFRFFRNQREALGQSDFEALNEDEGDISTLILGRDQVHRPDGTVDGRYKSLYLMSNGLGSPEFFLPWAKFVKDVWNLDGESIVQDFADSATPPITFTVKLATMKDPGSGYSIEGFGSNELPGWVNRGSYLGSLFAYIFDAKAVKLKPTSDPAKENPDATLELGRGVPAVYVAQNHKSWLAYKEVFGPFTRAQAAPLKALASWFDPDPVAQARPLSEKVKPFAWWAIGLKPRKQETAVEAKRRRNLEKQAAEGVEGRKAEKLMKGR